MENIKKRLDNSFRCSKKTQLEINCKKKKKKRKEVNFNYSVARVGYIFASYDVNGRSEISDLTFSMLIKSSRVKVSPKCTESCKRQNY